MNGVPVVVNAVGKPFRVNDELYVYGYLKALSSSRAVGSVLAEMFK